MTLPVFWGLGPMPWSCCRQNCGYIEEGSSHFKLDPYKWYISLLNLTIFLGIHVFSTKASIHVKIKLLTTRKIVLLYFY